MRHSVAQPNTADQREHFFHICFIYLSFTCTHTAIVIKEQKAITILGTHIFIGGGYGNTGNTEVFRSNNDIGRSVFILRRYR